MSTRRLCNASGQLALAGLAVGAASGPASRALAQAQEQVNFGEVELFSFDGLFEETRYGWSSGDLLTTDLDLNVRAGKITGRRNQRITPAVKAWGVTIIPEVRADTRTGARLDASLQATAGVELFAGLTFGGDGIDASLNAGPTLLKPGPVVAGQRFSMQGGSTLEGDFNFNPGLPTFDAGLDVILNGSFDSKFEYGLFPLAKYRVGDFGFDFDFDFNLFNFDFDLDLPDLSIDLPDFPVIPGSEDDDTLFRQKLPPSDPLLSIAELAIDNPLKSIETTSRLTDDGRLTTSTKGSLARAGLDLDGIASAVASGGFSFTGTSVSIGPGKLGYDLIDVKYGLEMGIEYDTEIDPFFNATLDFVDADGNATSVLLFDENGGSTQVTQWSGRWDELPDLALLSRDDVTVNVDFTDIEAIFSHRGALTLSDYMELQALKAFVNVLPGVKLVDLGPAYYQKFPLAGEFADFELFDASFSLGSIDILGGVWDGSFVLEAAPILDVALAGDGGSVKTPGDWIEIETGSAVTDLSDKSLVIGRYEAGDLNRMDVAPIDLVDPGTVTSTLNTTAFVVVGRTPDQVFILPNGQRFVIPGTPITETRTASRTVTLADDSVTTIDGLVLPDDASYTVAAGGARRFKLNYIENQGVVTGDGLLGFEAKDNLLTIEGDGTIAFNSPGRIAADLLIHGAGHTIRFNTFTADDLVFDELARDAYPVPSGAEAASFYFRDGVQVDTPPTTVGPAAAQHVFDVATLENAGTIEFAGSDFSLATSRFLNRDTGVVRVTGGNGVTITGNDFGAFGNSGLVEAVGAGSMLTLDQAQVGPWYVGDPNALNGITEVGPAGEIAARDGGSVRLDAPNAMFLSDQLVRAADGGTVDVDAVLLLGRGSAFVSEAGGTLNLNAALAVQQLDGFDINNAGTLNINSNVSLIPDVNVVRDPGQPQPAIRPIGLTNTGVVNVGEDARFTFGVTITNFANDGAVLDQGTWNLNGADGTFSNLVDSGGAEIDLRVLRLETESAGVLDFFNEFLENGEPNPLRLTSFKTALRTNAANVTFDGNAYFPYFNTVETNQGRFVVSGGHQFTTAKGLTNDGGAIVVNKGGDLFVQGALKVNGGAVEVGVGSTLTALTQTEPVSDDGAETRDITVEVIGGVLDIADAGYLAGTSMFFDRVSSDPRFVGLEVGQVWVVREQVLIGEDGLTETITPAAIHLGDAIIERNNGTIVIDGASARFDAAEAMQYNHGVLELSNGFEFNTRVDDFRNAPEGTMTLQGASFVVTGDTGTFRNDGDLSMDGDSYLFADQFVNGPNATFALDGVLDASLVTISAGSSITGAGTITGSIVNDGTLALGNSPGRIETFGSYVQGSSASALFEIEGFVPGVSYDQLVVREVESVEGEAAQPDLFVTLDGFLELDFSLLASATPMFEWLLIDHQGQSPILGGYEPGNVLVSGLLSGDPLDTGAIDTTGDLYLGHLDDLGLFLTYRGGSGNDLAVYAVPEPGVLAMAAAAGLAVLRRRGVVA
jgi:hypothetical protein